MKKNRQPKLRSEREFKSIILTINKNSWWYYKQQGLQRYEEELRMRVREMMLRGNKPTPEMNMRMSLMRRPI